MNSIFDLSYTFGNVMYTVSAVWTRKDIVAELIRYLGLELIHVILKHPEIYPFDEKGRVAIQEQCNTILRVLIADRTIAEGTANCDSVGAGDRKIRIDFFIRLTTMEVFNFYCITPDTLEECEDEIAAWRTCTGPSEPTPPEPVDFLEITRQIAGG